MTGMKSGAGEDPWDDEPEEPESQSEGEEALFDEEAEEDVSETTPADIIAEKLGEIEAGELRTNVNFRHEKSKAILAAMDESEELREELAALGDAVGVDLDPDELDQSSVARAAFLAGLASVAPEVLETFDEAEDKHEGDSLL
ncbi:hypothetical protein [Halobacterium noricense]|uniref:hypothetical protein n=1 Tax=Halobacterium noricense TaxID=223182 RepID=UPI001E3994DC|nr:hypothetical protein [Halobacterium noricense]UHH27279.1 hypothetical protein LT974_17430 [Halobacterium noricense]